MASHPDEIPRPDEIRREESGPTNRLAQESSPYLLQHRHNPVDWWPWGEEAFAEARRQNKPILLSVGYAACHWCHVMAHESFEDEAIAGLMNRLFVNIKVDREERPDVDALYQNALALLGEHGGWPLTMFLTPQGEPFWGGTYFPPSQRYGRPGFAQVLEGLAAAWRDAPDDVGKNVAAIRQGLERLAAPQPGGQLAAEAPLAAARRLLREIDPQEGGLGGAPKFPQPAVLELLWVAWLRSGEASFRHAVELTLTRMSQGGIYDHLGGGYARYATDEKWLVPHFEKMLYDNAQILTLLTRAWTEDRNPLYAARARETVEWLFREMRAEEAPGGPPSEAFAASLDADSEGEEGRFYIWGETEIDALLGPEEAGFFKAHYDVSAGGNWEGRTILNRSVRPALLDTAGEARLTDARDRLL
ncbi:MAG: thioredoxin domain-containing protein, partial [Tistlia sp.]